MYDQVRSMGGFAGRLVMAGAHLKTLPEHVFGDWVFGRKKRSVERIS